MPESKAYQIGDIIGQKYEVFGVLGKGGFGVVYMVYSHETHHVYALKTFRDEYLVDPETRALFRKEAQVWVDLERHPYLVRAYFVDEIYGRLYIVMEYIAPVENNPNTLQGYLDRRPPDLAQSLRWAIQFCHGMEYAYSKGVRCHRDIKPANIMISQDKTVKISDFGLAGVLGASKAVSGIQLHIQEGKVGLSFRTLAGQGVGTPTHMPLEQFYDVAYCDQRSDLYAFGIVLFQMASGGKLPFLPAPPKDFSQAEQMRFWQNIQRLHEQAPVPELSSPLFPFIQRCLEKMPEKRYQSFNELSNDLEPLLKQKTGEVVRMPVGKELEAWEMDLKGSSLLSLGRYDEAIQCIDKAIDLDPRLAVAWSNKGGSLVMLGRYNEAIPCFDKAIELNPHFAGAWSNKGGALSSLGRYDEAIQCLDKAIELDPQFAIAWYNKGVNFETIDRYEDSVRCYDQALKLDPRYEDAWYNKGISLGKLGHYEEAVRCYDQALVLDPRNAMAWYDKGISMGSLGRYNEAIQCHGKAIELDPRNVIAWYFKAVSEDALTRTQDAVRSYKQFLALAPAQYTKQIAHARQRLEELEGKG